MLQVGGRPSDNRLAAHLTSAQDIEQVSIFRLCTSTADAYTTFSHHFKSALNMFPLLPAIRAKNALLSINTSPRIIKRAVSTASCQKREGDISDAFASLSGLQFEKLPPRFADVKSRLIAGHEDALYESWHRLLGSLREEIPLIADRGPNIIPEIDISEIDNPSEDFKAEHRKRGVAVIRNVVPEQQALGMKKDLRA